MSGIIVNMEYLDVVDEQNNLTGETEEKDEIHRKGLWHREVAVWLVNKKGEILLQKRAASKKQGANKWAICAGHVDTGEDEMVAAKRELFEEVGLKADGLEFLFVTKVEDDGESEAHNNMFMYMYFLKTDAGIGDYRIQREELSELRYVDMKELERIVAEGDWGVTFARRKYMPKIIEELKKRI